MLPIEKIKPEIWGIIAGYLNRMTGQNSAFTLFILGTLSREIDKKLPKIPRDLMGNYPRGRMIFDLYRQKRITLNTARGLLQYHAIDNRSHEHEFETNSYTGSHLIQYRSRKSKELLHSKDDLCQIIDRIKSAVEDARESPRENMRHFERYSEKIGVAFFVASCVFIGCFFVSAGLLASASMDINKNNCDASQNHEEPTCQELYKKQTHGKFLTKVFVYVVFVSVCLSATCSNDIPKLAKKKRFSNSFYNTPDSLLKIYSGSQEIQSIITMIDLERGACTDLILYYLDEIKIMQPFLSKELQENNIQLLKRIADRIDENEYDSPYAHEMHRLV
jgi:hypothetical protein